MKRTHTFFSLLCLLLFVAGIVGCKGSEASQDYLKKLDAETLASAKAWKADRLGCNKVRVAPMAESFSPKFKEAGLNEKQISELLGEPEMRHEGEQNVILSYYFDGACENGKLKDGTVYCLLQFFMGLETGTVEMSSVVCG